ncbi:DUF3105 domain-containing protein [Pseudonocardia endophytica]|uniref:Uncharacterized protein DUF3105 n=1 Tax=Pseudonocardia endophytica TaxID=401976 RepID=A0A4R1HIK5_PSEEN|nr:DUF3105 domain-containing protein [Pseudonocardia endophytica]TCK20703.1 uncharacterized protein DUF3105 [Pseudonocardia endophytica]
MASGKTSNKSKRAPAVKAVNQRQIPWLMIGAIVLVIALAAVFIGYPLVQRAEARKWIPSDDNKDPSLAISGIVSQQYGGGQHIQPNQQVAYTKTPPFGGAHDGYWAACNGVVYPNPVRTENLVHSLEHGAVWIAYNPDQVTGADLDTLKAKVDGQPASVMSPWPGLATPISLQSWGHQLAVQSADDERIDQFIRSLRLNRFTYPEVGASCDALGPGYFDQDNPPPFKAIPPESAVDNQTVFPENLGSQGVAQDPAAGGSAPAAPAPAPGQ